MTSTKTFIKYFLLELMTYALIIVFLVGGILVGIDQELARRDRALIYDCARFGQAMNNWNRQHNLPEVCYEE